MGVYIPGMEMPKSCWRCSLSQLYEKPREMLVCKVTHEEVLRHKVDSACPLVPVPEHGRLIDADALMERFGYSPGDTAEDRIWIRAARRIIIEAPTIIPAEEGE